MFDEICRRTMNFIHSCINSDSDLVRSVVVNGFNGSRLYSPVGRNAVFCALRYRTPLHNIGATKLSCRALFQSFTSHIAPETLDLANVLREAALLRDGVLFVPGGGFCRDDFVRIVGECAR